jgi:hypothetical protein
MVPQFAKIEPSPQNTTKRNCKLNSYMLPRICSLPRWSSPVPGIPTMPLSTRLISKGRMALVSTFSVKPLTSKSNPCCMSSRLSARSNTAPESFTAPVNISNSVVTIPQFGSKITLAGRESKILVTNFRFGSAVLQYSTAEVRMFLHVNS